MAVKQCIPQVLREKCFDLFESRWPDEHPIEINAYKLMKLTGLASGTCLKIFNNPYYVPDFKVMNALCAFFDLQPGEFLYYERDIASNPSDRADSVKQIA
jgi:DNA-binding Xre family transcriptional regulator